MTSSPKSSYRSLTPPASPTPSASLPPAPNEWEFRLSVPIPQSKGSALQILFSLMWGLWGVFAVSSNISSIDIDADDWDLERRSREL